jgi:DNA-binding MarR family transcriptional regulator
MCSLVGEYQTAEMFQHSGHLRAGYELIDSFDIEGSKQAFAAIKQTTKADILTMIKKDPLISPETIAKVLGQSREWVARNIAEMIKGGAIKQLTNEDKAIVREILPGADDILKRLPPPKVTDVILRYSYQKRPIAPGPAIISTSRPFCVKMMGLSDSGRVYSRADIEQISAQLGYSVFERSGGFWRIKGTDKTEIQCRHYFRAEILLKKVQ